MIFRVNVTLTAVVPQTEPTNSESIRKSQRTVNESFMIILTNQQQPFRFSTRVKRQVQIYHFHSFHIKNASVKFERFLKLSITCPHFLLLEIHKGNLICFYVYCRFCRHI